MSAKNQITLLTNCYTVVDNVLIDLLYRLLWDGLNITVVIKTDLVFLVHLFASRWPYYPIGSSISVISVLSEVGNKVYFWYHLFSLLPSGSEQHEVLLFGNI